MTLKNTLANNGQNQNALKVATPGNIRHAMSNTAMQRQLKAMISDPKRRDSMVSSMVGMVQQTPGLQECELSTVYNAAIAGEALKLPYGFGYWYAVPRANNKKGKDLGYKKGDYKEATFQMGYKGFVQLAMRSGEYKDIDVYEIKKGELVNPHKRRITVEDLIYLEDRHELPTIGYLAFFELHNGFTKTVYMRHDEIVAHATEYSYFNYEYYTQLKETGKVIVEEYGKKKDITWKLSSNWYSDFDMMASKTVLKRLLSRWGILSVEMQSAIKADQAVVNEQGQPIDYPDNPKNNKPVIDAVDQKLLEESKDDDKPESPTPESKEDPEPEQEEDITKLFKQGK